MNVIERCLTVVEPSSVATATLSQLTGAITKAKAKKASLYGFESKAEEAIDRHIQTLLIQKIAVKSGVAGYRRFANLSPFTWRDKNGYPLLAVFGLDSPLCVLHVGYYGGGLYDYRMRFLTEFPAILATLYDDVAKRIVKRERGLFGRNRYTLRCEYTGLIPDSVKENIEKAQKVFENIFILAEGQNWTLESTPEPVNADPLVVGYDGKDLWLIDQFDLGSVERLIASEFTV